MIRDEMDVRPTVGRDDTSRCPICGKHVLDETMVFCSMKCKSQEAGMASLDNTDLRTLMRQYRQGNWEPVDGCTNSSEGFIEGGMRKSKAKRMRWRVNENR